MLHIRNTPRGATTRTDELREIEAAIAAGRCHRITLAETIAHNDRQREAQYDVRGSIRGWFAGWTRKPQQLTFARIGE